MSESDNAMTRAEQDEYAIPATAPQKALMSRLGINYPPNISLGMAGDLISHKVNRKERLNRAIFILTWGGILGGIAFYFLAQWNSGQ